jgi:hypothetical protein
MKRKQRSVQKYFARHSRRMQPLTNFEQSVLDATYKRTVITKPTLKGRN